MKAKETPNTLLVEIPVSFNVQRIQRDIGKAVKGKVAKTQNNQRFKIQTNQITNSTIRLLLGMGI